MSSEWKKTTLGGVSTWMSGGTPKKDVLAYWNGDIPWISANSMHGTRYSDSDLRITQSGLENGSRLAPPKTVLLLVRGGALHNRIPHTTRCRPIKRRKSLLIPISNQG
jgi:type I restriction enzyme, S subunit